MQPKDRKKYLPSLVVALMWPRTRLSSPLRSFVLRRKKNISFTSQPLWITYCSSSPLVTARNMTFPLASFRDLNSPTPSRKLRAFWRAFWSGMTDSACLLVISWRGKVGVRLGLGREQKMLHVSSQQELPGGAWIQARLFADS